jgi:ATP phosphoribosyltransferase
VIDDGIILRSQANLVAARGARWEASARASARLVLDRLAGEARARDFCEVRTRFAGLDDGKLREARERFAIATPFGGPTSSGMVTLHCPPAHVHALASFLREQGAETVTVNDLDYIFARENQLYAKLEAGLDR